jgi:hypothetical protein
MRLAGMNSTSNWLPGRASSTAALPEPSAACQAMSRSPSSSRLNATRFPSSDHVT